MSDEKFMKIAIEEAKKSPFPFGAILVKDGKVIAKSGDNLEPQDPVTAHAEISVIRQACKILNNKHIPGTVLYSTCEPCPMCFTAAWWAHISKIVYGISLEDSNNLFGEELLVKSSYLNSKTNNKIELMEGVLRDEILKLINNKK